MQHLKIFLFALFLSSSGILQAQLINSEKSAVHFTISNLGFNTVEGTFKGLEGEIRIDEDDLNTSSIRVCLQVKTVSTGNTTRDKHLLEKEFFAADTYPEICFNSTSFSKTKEGYAVNGKLSIRGITKIVSVPFQLKQGVLIGHFSINRLDFKIGEDYNTFTIGNKVDIEVSCSASPSF